MQLSGNKGGRFLNRSLKSLSGKVGHATKVLLLKTGRQRTYVDNRLPTYLKIYQNYLFAIFL